MAFISRIIWAPLLVILERDLHISHSQAGSLFFWISLGVCLALMGSGFVASRWTHRGAVLISVTILGCTLIALHWVHDLTYLRLGLFTVGLSAGLYFPSGITAVTSLVAPRDWGKALAVHELAPNAAFIMAPLLVEALVLYLDWRQVTLVLGLCAFMAGLAYLRFGEGGEILGQAPRLAVVGRLMRLRSYWIMVTTLGLAVGASVGVYTMIPLYLVTARGMELSLANKLLSLSRISGVVMALLSGWVVDRMGARRAMMIVLLGTGLLTIGIGVAPGKSVIAAVFLQPMLAVTFFPAAFAAVPRIVPASQTNVAVGFISPVAALMGAGVVPGWLGSLAERGAFSTGFVSVGLSIALSAMLIRYLLFVDGGLED